MMFTAEAHSLEDLPRLAKELFAAFPSHRVFAFEGEMGAGKTTFIKQACTMLGVKDNMSSPTFALVNQYSTKDGDAVYHFDFYRLRSEREAWESGFEEILDSGSYCFVEWPSKADSILPEGTVHVKMTVIDGVRFLSATL